MSRIYWDTMLFVYWLEGHPQYGDRVGSIARRMDERQDELVTSTFTLGELLVGPYKRGASEIAARIEEVLSGPFVRLIPFTAQAATRYAQIRSRMAVTAPDALHLACAAEAHVDLFLTNDNRLAGKTVPGIQFVAGMNTDLF
jgi:predicted nucleic acid-binding protein